MLEPPLMKYSALLIAACLTIQTGLPDRRLASTTREKAGGPAAGPLFERQALAAPVLNAVRSFGREGRITVFEMFRHIGYETGIRLPCFPTLALPGAAATFGTREVDALSRAIWMAGNRLEGTDGAKPPREVGGDYVDPFRVQEVIYTCKRSADGAAAVLRELGWRATAAAVWHYARRHGLVAAWQRRNPALVQHIVEKAQSTRHALQLLKEQGMSFTSTNLLIYLARHGLVAPWRKPAHTRLSGVKPDRVQRIVRRSMNRSEATQLVNRKLGLSVTESALYQFIRRHRLQAPWRQPDSHAVQSVIEKTRSLHEAVEAVMRELNWRTTRNSLSMYAKQHGLWAPWRRQGGYISCELVVFLAVAAIFLAVSGSLRGFSPVTGHVRNAAQWTRLAKACG